MVTHITSAIGEQNTSEHTSPTAAANSAASDFVARLATPDARLGRDFPLRAASIAIDIDNRILSNTADLAQVQEFALFLKRFENADMMQNGQFILIFAKAYADATGRSCYTAGEFPPAFEFIMQEFSGITTANSERLSVLRDFCVYLSNAAATKIRGGRIFIKRIVQ